MALYSEDLFHRLPESARSGIVGQLCRPDPDTNAAPLRDLIEAWVEALQPSAKTRAYLTSPHDNSVWSGFWELVIGRAFAEMGFEVDMNPDLAGKTPDLLVRRDDLTAMVEVLAVRSNQATQDEQARLDRIAQRVHAGVDFPEPGLLSLSANAVIGDDPPDWAIERLVEAISPWLRTGSQRTRDFNHTPVKCSAHWWPADGPTRVVMSPAPKFLGESPRIGQRVSEKVSRYAPLVTPDRRLLVAVAEQGWTVTRSQAVTGLFGSEQVTFTDGPSEARLHFDGRGAAVAGGPVGNAATDRLSGVFYARRLWDDQNRALVLDASFIYNPYCADPLAPDTFAPLPEMQVVGGHMTWVRDDANRYAFVLT